MSAQDVESGAYPHRTVRSGHPREEPLERPARDTPLHAGYGIVGPGEGRGLLPWSWAEERLVASHDYWVATVWPDGRPHVMPVWGIWKDESVWFSSSVRSRKARNLGADPRCVVTTDNPTEPVVVEGVAEVVRELGAIEDRACYATAISGGFAVLAWPRAAVRAS